VGNGRTVNWEIPSHRILFVGVGDGRATPPSWLHLLDGRKIRRGGSIWSWRRQQLSPAQTSDMSSSDIQECDHHQNEQLLGRLGASSVATRMAKVLAVLVLSLSAVAPWAGAWTTTASLCAAPRRQECAIAGGRDRRLLLHPRGASLRHLASIGRNEPQQGTTEDAGEDPNFLKEELARYLETRREIGADQIAQQYVACVVTDKNRKGADGDPLADSLSHKLSVFSRPFAPCKGMWGSRRAGRGGTHGWST
jgi:hypothetical protein